MPHVREKPPLRLHWQATAPGGKTYRWGEDEPEPINVPGGVSFSTTMPGGFEQASLTLPRKPAREYGDLERLTTLTCYGPGGDVAWQGRLERAPRVSGDQMAVSPAAVGWQAHLEDDKSATMIYRDVDLTRWTDVVSTRWINLIGAGYRVEGGPTVAPGESASLVLNFQRTGDAAPACEGLYDAGPNTRIDGINGDWTVTNTTPADTNYTFVMQAQDTPDATGTNVASADMAAAASGTLGFSPTVPQRYMAVIWRYDTATAASPGADRTAMLTNLAVYGDHLLTGRGVEPNAGFYASDIVGHAIPAWAPLLNVDVQPSGYIIHQLAFFEPTTAGEIVRQATRFGLQDWAVWEGRAGPTFYWHNRGQRGRSWRARIAPSQLEETGESVERLYESVIVQYQDVDGRTVTVGPTGSGADTEDNSLADTDPENPAVKAGITKRALLTTGIMGDPDDAVQIGARFLEEQKQLDASGSAQLVGHVEDDKGVLHPAWRVRAGDTITFVDAADPGPRRIVRTNYDHGTRTCSVDIDAPPEGLQALLERFGADLQTVRL